MHINTQIARGMERLIARREGARLEGLFGLAGLATVETFGALADVLDESGFVGTAQHVRDLRREHAAKCARIRKALPVAMNARRLMIETGGDLSGIFSKVGKALKKVAKVAVKLSPSHQLIKKIAPKAALFSPSQMLALKLDPPKAKAAKAIAAAGATNATPDAAAAAVLANQAGVTLATPDAQAYAQQLVASGGGGGGGMIPTESMFTPPADGAADDGTIFGMSPLVAAGAGAAILVGGYLLLRRRRN